MSETYTLDIDSDRGKLLVSWNDLDTLAKYAGTQAGFYLDTERDLFKLHDKHFKEWNQMFWSQRQNLKMFDSLYNLEFQITFLFFCMLQYK